MSIDFLNELNEKQKKAVMTTEGPCLIIAGAGTGKTRVLTTRIAYLLKEKCVRPENILVLTFTNKTAREMCDRIAKIVRLDLKNLFCGTFHTCFAKILRVEHEKIGYSQHFSIYDTSDSKSVIFDIIKNKNLPEDIYLADDIIQKISLCKNNIITADEYNKNTNFIEQDKKNNNVFFGEIYAEYTMKCKQSNSMDFDDILLNTYTLLKNNSDICDKYKEQFKYIFIDEFQDTNKIQYDIVQLLSAKYNNICVVGDDSQSIYSFRGATIDNILNFPKDNTRCNVVKLELTYRSAQNIVGVANSVISNNKNRIPKTIVTNRQENGEIHIIKALTSSDEAHSVALFIDNIVKEKKIKYSDIAVLYRTQAQTIPIETEFNRVGIKYKIYGGVSLFQKKIIKNIIGYLRVIVNPYDIEGIKLSINEPRRGLGGTVLEKIYEIVEKENISLWEAFTQRQELFNKKSNDLLAKYINIIKDGMAIINTCNAYEVLNTLIENIGILGKLKNCNTEKTKQDYADIIEFIDITKMFVNSSTDGNKDLYSFLQYLLLNGSDSMDAINSTDVVSLMTVHMSKGLEFKCVCLVGLEDGKFPLILDNENPKQIEEERRLFYVAITRGRDILALSFSKTLNRKGKLEMVLQSRFFGEIDKKYLGNTNIKSLEDIKEKAATLVGNYAKYSAFNFSIINKPCKPQKNNTSIQKISENAKFFHPQYGFGIITRILDKNTNMVEVKFEEYGFREFIYNPEKVLVCT